MKIFRELPLFFKILWASPLFLVLDGAAYVFCQWYPVSQGPPSEVANAFAHLAIIPAFFIVPFYLGAFLYPFAGIVCAIKFKKYRRLFLLSLLAAPLWFLIGTASIKQGWAVRMHGIEKAVQRLDPLIRSIDSYIVDHGKPPSNLDELAPSYLNEAPISSMRGYAKISYSTEMESTPSDSYELHINCEYLLTVFDCLVYRPSHRYPADLHDGDYEPILDWAYVND